MSFYLRIISYLKNRKCFLLLFLIFSGFICILTIRDIRPDTSIYSMLPASPEILQKFRFLQGKSSQFNIILHIQALPGTGEELGVEKIESLCRDLRKDKTFLRVESGRKNGLTSKEMDSSLLSLPLLFDEKFEKELSSITEEKGIRNALKSHYKQWLFPTPSPFARRMGQDPLLLVPLMLKEIQTLNSVMQFDCELKDGYFRSKEGKSLFIFIKTASDLMDTRQSKETIDRLETLLIPYAPQLQISVISPLVHAIWNEKIMIRDAARTLSAMSVALFLVILFAFRQWKALVIYIIPMLTILPATFFLYLLSGKVSALALGVGALISGITVDFCIHLYIALKANDGDAEETLKQVHQPLFISFCTTFFAFGAFLFSSVEGFRQIALFALGNLLFSYLFSVLFLPLFNIRRSGTFPSVNSFLPPLLFKKFWIWIWFFFITASLFYLNKLSFHSRIEQFDGIPETVRQTEEEFFKAAGRKKFHEFVVSGKTREEVLIKTEHLLELLKKEKIETPGFLRFLVSNQKTEENKKRWGNFWKIKKETLKQGLLKYAPSFGFDTVIFKPFLDSIENPLSVPCMFLDDILSPFLFTFQGTWFVSFPLSSSLESEIAHKFSDLPEGTFVFKKEDFFNALSSGSKKELLLFGIISALFTLFVLIYELKNLKGVALTMLPVLSSVLGFLGLMSFSGLPVNPAHLLSLIMVIGLAEDYANFMLDYCRKGGKTEACLSVSLSALTTLLGSGILAFAEHPVLKSIGVTVFGGVFISLWVSLCVIPAFCFLKKDKAV